MYTGDSKQKLQKMLLLFTCISRHNTKCLLDPEVSVLDNYVTIQLYMWTPKH